MHYYRNFILSESTRREIEFIPSDWKEDITPVHIIKGTYFHSILEGYYSAN